MRSNFLCSELPWEAKLWLKLLNFVFDSQSFRLLKQFFHLNWLFEYSLPCILLISIYGITNKTLLILSLSMCRSPYRKKCSFVFRCSVIYKEMATCLTELFLWTLKGNVNIPSECSHVCLCYSSDMQCKMRMILLKLLVWKTDRTA